MIVMQRILKFTLVFLFIVQCSKMSTSEQSSHIFVLDEVPQRIQEIENLTVFNAKSEPPYTMELIPKQTYGKNGEPFLTKVSGSVIDANGRAIIWNVDSNYDQILYVFNTDGTYHTTLGRKGKGPGEYGHIVGIQAKAGKIFVLDFTSQRLNEYSIQDYSFLDSKPFERWNSGEKFQFGYVETRKDGNYLVTFSDTPSRLGRLEVKFHVMDSMGKSVNNFEPLIFPAGFRIKVRQSMQPTMPLAFLGKTITHLSDEDELFAAWSKDFLIRKYDANGVYQSAIYYPVQGSPFDLQAYTRNRAFSPKAGDIEKTFANMDQDLPERFPVIEKLMVDDENRIWVAVPMGVKSEDYEWWVLKESGELLAKLQLPKAQPIFEVKNGYLYSKMVDETTGSEYAVKYRIELKEK